MFSACDGGAVCLGLAVLVREVFLNFSGSNRCREPFFEDFSGKFLSGIIALRAGDASSVTVCACVLESFRAIRDHSFADIFPLQIGVWSLFF
jgi:hypothetical protein